MQTPESITQATPVSEADRLLSVEGVVVHASESLQQVAEQAVRNPACRLMAVVDDLDRLVGVLPVRTLVDDIFVKIVPEQFLGKLDDYSGVMDYAERLRARAVGDVMLDAISVQRAQTVREAFELLHRHELAGLPIVDEERHVVGYIDQLELLLVWVRATGRNRLLNPGPIDEPRA